MFLASLTICSPPSAQRGVRGGDADAEGSIQLVDRAHINVLINWVTEIRAPLAASGYWHPEAASWRSPDAPHQRTKPINALDALPVLLFLSKNFPVPLEKSPVL